MTERHEQEKSQHAKAKNRYIANIHFDQMQSSSLSSNTKGAIQNLQRLIAEGEKKQELIKKLKKEVVLKTDKIFQETVRSLIFDDVATRQHEDGMQSSQMGNSSVQD